MKTTYRSLINKCNFPLLGALTISGILHALTIYFLSTTFGFRSPPPINPELQIHIQIEKKQPLSLQKTERRRAIPQQASPHQEFSKDKVGSVFSSKYYEAKELDLLPNPIKKIEPRFPAEALKEGATGVVHLEMFIDENGRLELIRVLDTIKQDRFKNAAIEAFKDQKFNPGIKNGIPVKSHIKLIINFENSTQENPS
jgi:TonB family protein